MSLKAFHILFIALSDLLAAGCAWWAFSSNINVFGTASAIAAVALFIYGIYFVRKSRRLIL
jgi:membrane protein implicated in regulation of membrane protease activity